MGQPSFSCEGCGIKYPWKPEYAGRKTRCRCGQVVTIPTTDPAAAARADEGIDLADDSDYSVASAGGSGGGAGAACPSCGNGMAEGAILCVNCGYNLKTGRKVNAGSPLVGAGSNARDADAAARGKGVKGLTMALVAGAAAAVLSGVIWGAVARTTGMEIGYVAVGVGLLTGFAMMLVADEGSDVLGMYAALMAFGGLVIGKLLIVSWAFVPIVAAEAEKSPWGMMLGVEAVSWEVAVQEGHGELSDWLTNTTAQGMLQATQLGGEVTPQDPPQIVHDQMDKMVEKLGDRMQEIDPPQLKTVISSFLHASIARLSVMERLKLTFSWRDALWTFLAVSSAYKLGAGFSVNRGE